MKSQQFLISAFSIEENPRRSLFLLFEQYKTPAVLYFSILNWLKPEPYLILVFSVEENPSPTSILIFKQNKTPAVR